MEKNIAYAYLSIDEFSCPAHELTQRIGLQPTEAWQVGDVVAPVPLPRKHSAWRIQSRLPHSEEVERHLVDVLDQICGHEAALRDLARSYPIRLQCVGYYKEYNPGFRLDAETVRRAAECGVAIDLDSYQYFMGDEEVQTKSDA